MKSLKAQLMAAIAMTLVAALTIGSSTYAWFTMNTQVQASGMKVKASSGGNLLIALPKDDGSGNKVAPAVSEFKTAIDFAMTTADTLSPASTVNLTNWYKTKASDIKSSAKDTSASFTDVGSDGYCSQKFYLYAGQAMDVYMSSLTATVPKGTDGAAISVLSDGTNPLWNSLRVGVKVGSKYCIYALTAVTADGSAPATHSGTDANAKGVAGTSASSASSTVINTDSTVKVFHAIASGEGSVAANSPYVCASLSAETPTEAMAYIWFEGEDGSCYTNNFQAETVSITFNLAQVESAS